MIKWIIIRQTDLRALNLRLKALAATTDEDQKNSLPGMGEKGGKGPKW